MPHIHIRKATLAYNGDVVFSDLDLDLPASKWTALLGPSGVGKSSLLRMLAGLTLPQENMMGSIEVDNAIPLTQQIAYMAQSDLLLPWLTVLGNAILGLRLRGVANTEHTKQVEKAKLLLEKVGLKQNMHLYPHQLSGGMRQRVALVRTLMQDKPIVLMDEPFSALDAITRHKLQALAADLLRDKTVFFITHDATEALRLAHSIYMMSGRPATLKWITTLCSSLPRQLDDPEVMQGQALLFNELTQAAGEGV
jgi:putative hydroxymethylpyrimidine transport system ATP-binding protein